MFSIITGTLFLAILSAAKVISGFEVNLLMNGATAIGTFIVGKAGTKLMTNDQLFLRK